MKKRKRPSPPIRAKNSAQSLPTISKIAGKTTHESNTTAHQNAVPHKDAARKNVVLRAAFSLGATCLFIIGLTLYATSRPDEDLAVTLFSASGAVIDYGGLQQSGVSPLCGCVNDLASKEWRGIVFPAHQIQFWRLGLSKLTRYRVVSPEARLITRVASLPFAVRWRELSIPSQLAFDPQLAFSRAAVDRYVTIRSGEFFATELALTSAAPLNASLSGRLPLAAWLPTEGAHVSLARKPRSFPGSEGATQISEVTKTYSLNDRDHIPEEDRTLILDKNTLENLTPDYTMGSPMMDIMGTTTIWFDQPVQLLSSGYSLPIGLSLGESAEAAVEVTKRTVVVFQVEPAFSLRITAEPKQTDNTPLDDAILREDGIAGVDIQSDPRDVETYSGLFERVKSSDRMFVRLPGTTSQAEFRYPPVPPTAGFNIFGPVRGLVIDGAVGQLGHGVELADIRNPSELRVRNIEHITPIDEISLRMSLGPGAVTERFETVATILVNGEDIHSVLDEKRRFITLAGEVVGLVVAPFTICGVIYTIKQKKVADALSATNESPN